MCVTVVLPTHIWYLSLGLIGGTRAQVSQVREALAPSVGPLDRESGQVRIGDRLRVASLLESERGSSQSAPGTHLARKRGQRGAGAQRAPSRILVEQTQNQSRQRRSDRQCR